MCLALLPSLVLINTIQVFAEFKAYCIRLMYKCWIIKVFSDSVDIHMKFWGISRISGKEEGIMKTELGRVEERVEERLCFYHSNTV